MALQPILKALGTWGLQFMTDEREEDAFQAHWLAQAGPWADAAVAAAEPGAAPVVIQLLVSGKAAVIEVGSRGVQARDGRTAAPELTFEGPLHAVRGLFAGVLDLEGAMRAGLAVTGDPGALARLRLKPSDSL